MSEQLLDAYSVVNDDGIPKIGSCLLVVGDGTQKVEFKNGRAKVPLSLAHLVNRNQHIEIPALDAGSGQHFPSTAAPEGAQGDGQVDDEKAIMAARIAELEAMLANNDAQPAPAGWTDASEQAQTAASDEEAAAERLRLAQEHLAEEGITPPELEVSDEASPTPPPVPAGFDATTADGQPRCLAAKGDGSQCANPAVDNGSCGLAKHKEQLTSS